MAENPIFCSRQPGPLGARAKTRAGLCREQLCITLGWNLQCWAGVEACLGLPTSDPKRDMEAQLPPRPAGQA